MNKANKITEIKKTLINAYAKINYSINIKGLIPDGKFKDYHDVELIMETIPLCDYITIWTEVSKDKLPECANPDDLANRIEYDVKTDKLLLPADKNIAFKAAKAVIGFIAGSEDHSKKPISNITKIHIYIEKGIPLGGGLGGSSADASGVIKGLNEHLSLGLTLSEMKQIGALLGADVPFLIEGGMGLATGIGEEIRPLPAISKGFIVIATPRFEMSTKEVYRKYDDIRRGGLVNGGFIKTIQGTDMFDEEGHLLPGSNDGQNGLTKETETLVNALESGDLDTFYANLYNVLEIPAFALNPGIAVLKRELSKTNARAVLMSGSGASCYAIYDRQSDARKAITEVSNEIDVLMSKSGLLSGLDCLYTICDISRLH